MFPFHIAVSLISYCIVSRVSRSNIIMCKYSAVIPHSHGTSLFSKGKQTMEVNGHGRPLAKAICSKLPEDICHHIALHPTMLYYVYFYCAILPFYSHYVPLPSGKLTVCYGKSLFSSWVNPQFLWPFSIAFCMFTRRYLPFIIH